MNKDYIELFLKRKEVKNIIISLTNEQRVGIMNFFNHMGGYRKSEGWFKQLAIWCNLGVSDFVDRKLLLDNLGTQKLNLEISIIKYGEKSGTIFYENNKNRSIKNFKNVRSNWENSSLSDNEITSNIKKIQSNRGKLGLLSKIRNGGTRSYTIRCKEYWYNKGYSDKECEKIISNIQKRDITFFKRKYGEIEGNIKFQNISTKKRNTWNNKTKEEIKKHFLKTRPKKYNENGLEISHIKKFIEERGFDEKFCMYGSPEEQFYQYIPSVGFRRYDLAVFRNIEKTDLMLIYEYHGYGHINFSDYDSSLEDQYFKDLRGKELKFLPKIGCAYLNDKIKKEHIINNYKDVKYIVEW